MKLIFVAVKTVFLTFAAVYALGWILLKLGY